MGGGFPCSLIHSPLLPCFAHPRRAPSFARLLARLFDLSARKRKGNVCYAGYLACKVVINLSNNSVVCLSRTTQVYFCFLHVLMKCFIDRTCNIPPEKTVRS